MNGVRATQALLWLRWVRPCSAPSPCRRAGSVRRPNGRDRQVIVASQRFGLLCHVRFPTRQNPSPSCLTQSSSARPPDTALTSCIGIRSVPLSFQVDWRVNARWGPSSTNSSHSPAPKSGYEHDSCIPESNRKARKCNAHHLHG